MNAHRRGTNGSEAVGYIGFVGVMLRSIADCFAVLFQPTTRNKRALNPYRVGAGPDGESAPITRTGWRMAAAWYLFWMFALPCAVALRGGYGIAAVASGTLELIVALLPLAIVVLVVMFLGMLISTKLFPIVERRLPREIADSSGVPRTSSRTPEVRRNDRDGACKTGPDGAGSGGNGSTNP